MRFHRVSIAVMFAAALFCGMSVAAQESDRHPAADREIQVEFVQPVYRNCKDADLAIVLPEGDTHRKAEVEVLGRDDKPVLKCSFRLKDGFNYYDLRNAGELADGRYPVVVSFGDTAYHRLLRVEHVPEIEAPDSAIEERTLLFTPDKYVVKEATRNFKVKLTQAEAHRVWSSDRPEVVYVVSNGVYKAEDGSFIGTGTEFTYSKWQLYGEPSYPFVARAEKPEGPYVQIDEAPARAADSFKDVFTSSFALSCILGVNVNGDSKEKYELYDPARHGTYRLEDVRMIQNMEPHDYGCVKAGYRTYWTIVTTSTGDKVFLSDKPVFRDVPDYKGDLYDDGFMTNDNFGNSWYSADSTRLYLARGQTVRRSAPYDVPYDLLPNCSRILTVYSTTDGINWDYVHTLTSSGPYDTPYSQQYGGGIYYNAAAGLYICFIEDYDSDMQRVSIDLEYGRDGVNFYDFPDNDTGFLVADGLEDFYFCAHGVGHDVISHDGKYYQSCIISMSYPHCSAEPLFLHDRYQDLEDDDYEKVFKDRGMKEKLPYFDEVGGWKGLLQQLRDGECVATIMSYRADGWFYVDAGKKPVRFTTNEIVGGGMLNVNAAVAEDGTMTVELLDGGKVLEKAEITGDAIRIPAFEVPEGEYSVRIRMKNAKLYAMYID